jgi:hypothetical protein
VCDKVACTDRIKHVSSDKCLDIRSSDLQQLSRKRGNEISEAFDAVRWISGPPQQTQLLGASWGEGGYIWLDRSWIRGQNNGLSKHGCIAFWSNCAVEITHQVESRGRTYLATLGDGGAPCVLV